MSESKMLAIAFCLTMANSLVTAGAFYVMGLGPLAVVMGGTLAGVVTYVAICLLSSPYVITPVEEVFVEEECNV